MLEPAEPVRHHPRVPGGIAKTPRKSAISKGMEPQEPVERSKTPLLAGLTGWMDIEWPR
jgi:hypothetical protein